MKNTALVCIGVLIGLLLALEVRPRLEIRELQKRVYPQGWKVWTPPASEPLLWDGRDSFRLLNDSDIYRIPPHNAYTFSRWLQSGRRVR